MPEKLAGKGDKKGILWDDLEISTCKDCTLTATHAGGNEVVVLEIYSKIETRRPLLRRVIHTEMRGEF